MPRIFFDDFDNAAVGLQTEVLGSATVTEAGSSLTLTLPSGVGNEFAFAYVTVEDIRVATGFDLRKTFGYIEARLTADTNISDSYPYIRIDAPYPAHPGGVGVDYLYYWYTGQKIDAARQLFGAAAAVMGTVPGTGTPPVRMRLYWNNTGKPQTAFGGATTGVEIKPGEVSHWGSLDDGVTWGHGWTGQSAADLHDKVRIGLAHETWNSYPSVASSWDWMDITVLSEDSRPTVEPEDGNESAYEDRLTLPTAGGPPKHSDTVGGRGVGQLIPGPKNQTTGSTGPFDVGAYEDRLGISHGGRSRPGEVAKGTDSNTPGLQDQLAFQPAANSFGTLGLQSYFEDELYLLLTTPDGVAEFSQDAQDPLGNDELAGRNATHAFLYDRTGEDWSGPQTQGNGFHGVGADGKWYYDGEECGPGDFAVSGVPNKKAWKDLTNPLASSLVTPDVDFTYPTDTECRIATNAAISGWADYRLSSAMSWFIDGDFDVEVWVKDLSYTGDGRVSIGVFRDWNRRAYIGRRPSSYDRDVNLSGSWGNYSSSGTSGTDARFRIVRTGTNILTYYWGGSSWVQLGGSSNMGSSDPVYVHLTIQGDSFQGGGTFYNFAINSGTVVNTAGWYNEAQATNDRGDKQEFPERSLLVKTDGGLDIIDLATGKLWMRGLFGASTMVLGEPRRPAMQEGLLLLPMLEGALWMNFNMDYARIHRNDASAYTGGHYKTPSGGAATSNGMAQGNIQFRNAGYGFSGDYTDWQLPSHVVRHATMRYSSPNLYWAFVTDSGVAIFKWVRWSLEDVAPANINLIQRAEANEVTSMWWCRIDPANGDLLYMDDTTIYVVDQTTYENRFLGAFGGKWDATSTKALPGERFQDSQKVLIPYGSYYFHPTNEGIYRIDWPSGSWVLFYGKAGSGATHEILPEFFRAVTSICIGQDGANDLLIADLHQYELGMTQTVAISLTTNVIYAKSTLILGNKPTGELQA